MIHTTLIERIKSTKVKDLAMLLNIKPTAIYMWLSRGKVPPRYWGPLVYYFKLDPTLLKVATYEKSELHQD